MTIDADLGLQAPEAVKPKRERSTDLSAQAASQRKAARDAPRGNAIEAPLSLASLARWAVTEEHVEAMEATQLIWRDIVALGHLLALIGAAGSGKSAVARMCAAELGERGYDVYYFQEDASAGDLPGMHEHAREHGYNLLNSTLSGSTPIEQLDLLERLVVVGTDLSTAVLIFDTLKKYVDVMSKGGARAFFALMRALTQRGATVIVLGHTNKHLGNDGKPVFEGVGDVRNDTDDLIYIDAVKDADGVQTVTLRPDKTRCRIKPATFTLNTHTMEIRALDRVIDVQEVERERRQRSEDADVIEAIDAALKTGGVNRSELVDKVSQASGHGMRAVRKVLDRYCHEDQGHASALWLVTHLRTNNARYITVNPRRVCGVSNVQTVQTTKPGSER